MLGMVRRAEACFYDQLTNSALWPNAWRELYQQLVLSVKPLFVHRGD